MMNVLYSDSDCEDYTETSDSDDMNDTESTYGGNAQSIFSSLDESIGKIDDFLAYERGFAHGDVVCSVADPSGQLGRVVDVDMVVDLETISGELIKDINSKNLLRVRRFASGDYVIYGPWLGKVDKLYDAVTIMFNDGARCEIMTRDSEILAPLSPSPFEDAPFLYYPGQRVRIKVPTVSRSVRWLCGAWKAIRDEGTVCNVEVGMVHVNWIASVVIDSGESPSTPCHLQDPKNLKLLSCFPYANWQLGDWCALSSDYFNNLQMSTENFSPPSVVPKCITEMRKLDMDYQYRKQVYVIAKTKSKVDVLWQDGSHSAGLDSQTLLPVNDVGDHDFWPEQFVLEKVALEDVHASSAPRLGIVQSVDGQQRTVKVKWKSLGGESSQEMVSAYELIEHPEFSYCIGDIVFRVLPHVENLEDGPLDSLMSGLSQGIDLPFTGSNNTSYLLEKDTFKRNHTSDFDAQGSAGYLSCIGNVINFKGEGIEVSWASGLISKVHPAEIFGLDRLDGLASVPSVIQETILGNVSKQMAEQEKQSRLKKGKAINNSSEACETDLWCANGFFFPCASVGFLRNIATSLFGPGSSTSILGFWKGVPEFESLKTEEAQLDVDDIGPESLKQDLEEADPKDSLTFSSGNEETGMLKQFDSVDDYSDHHFVFGADKGLASQQSQVKRSWLKKIQQEWSILKKDLPDSIYIRVYEERIDLMRACIVGAPGTPYHDGLFFFDIFFPPDYPSEPPLVHYNSGGLRLNPNLYESGKVCLSLLNTWTGTDTEMWNPESSTILQVLLSLQALVLNDKPYFNEAGYDKQIGRAEGEKNSITYNENAFLLSCKSMIYTLHKPPKHFEALVEKHFTHRSHHILLACKAYMGSAQVGCTLDSSVKAGDNSHNSCSSTGFKIMLAKLFPKLVSVLTEKGVDCSQFLE